MDMKSERVRESLNKIIEKYGHTFQEALIASQKLDLYINKYMRREERGQNS